MNYLYSILGFNKPEVYNVLNELLTKGKIFLSKNDTQGKSTFKLNIESLTKINFSSHESLPKNIAGYLRLEETDLEDESKNVFLINYDFFSKFALVESLKQILKKYTIVPIGTS